MRVAIYARVSTDRGEQDPMVQVEALRRYLDGRGDEVVEEFIDRISGVKVSRPGLGAVVQAVESGRLDAVAIVKLDRLARSVHQLIQLAAFFEEHKVDLIVKDQAIDTSTPAGKLMFHVLGAMAEFERDLISERTKAGIGASDGYSRQGKRLGRPRIGLNMLEVCHLVAECGSVQGAAVALGIPRSTLRDHLIREGKL